MLDTVAAALMAGVINSGRVYPGARLLSLTALDHDAYPPGSGLCTMVCVVRWCGPPGVAWVATDLDVSPSRFPESDIIAEGALPDGLVVEFHRAGLLHTPRMSSEASRPLPPPPRFVIAALRPRLCNAVDVAPDGSISRRTAQSSDGACPGDDRVWRTCVHLVAPMTTATRQNVATLGRCLSGTLSHDAAVPGCVTRTVAKAIASALVSIKSPASLASTRSDASTLQSCHSASKIPNRGQSRQDTHLRQDAQPEARTAQVARTPEASTSAQQAPQTPERSSMVSLQNNSNATYTARPAVATSPPIVTHAKCVAAGCAVASKAGTGKIVRVECTAGCRVTFHRPCWRAMAISATDTRPCMTPDCWGLWARVTSTRRAVDGSETPPYVEWARTPRRPPASVTAPRDVCGTRPVTVRKPCPSNARSHVTPADPGRRTKDGGEIVVVANNIGNDSDGYVGRIRRRRLRQRQNGPPHKRLESVKTLARLSEDGAPPTVVAGGACVESALAEQEMTRAKRRLAIMPVVVRSADLGATVPKTKRTRMSVRPTREPRGNDSAPPNPTTIQTDAIATGEACKPVAAPTDLNGAWAAFFEWDSVPPSLVPEAPAARPSTEGLWTPPPLLVMAGGGAALCCPAAVWSCFCQRALAA